MFIYDLVTYETKLSSVPKKSSTYFDSCHINVSISKLVGQFSALTVILTLNHKYLGKNEEHTS